MVRWLFFVHVCQVVYMASNCGAASGRDSFMRTLNKFVDIDSVGKCARTKDFPGPLRGLEFDAATGRSKRDHWDGKGYESAASALLQRYKFRLVIANSLCEDYTTEKLFDCFRHGVVPIYLGSPGTYRQWDPGLAAGVHPAAIHAPDFDSMEGLARHILALAHDDKKYHRYFEFLDAPSTLPYPVHAARLLAQGHVDRGHNASVTSGTLQSWEQFACGRLEARDDTQNRGLVKVAQVPAGCHGHWLEWFTSLGKNMTLWANAQPPPSWHIDTMR